MGPLQVDPHAYPKPHHSPGRCRIHERLASRACAQRSAVLYWECEGILRY